MMTYSEKKQRQIATYALLAGPELAIELYSISQEVLNSYLDKLISGDIPFFTAIRNELISYCRSKGVKGASDIWGISPTCLEKLMDSFPEIESTKHYIDKPCTISPQDMKSWTTLGVQPMGPNDESTPKKRRKVGEDKRKVTNYSISQKIEAVKEFVKGVNQSETARELQIPAVNLMRWRDKLRKEAFQEPHVENLYGAQKRGQRNKMFRDLDQTVYDWYKEHKDTAELDEGIISQAKALAKIDDAEPVVKEIWLINFKKQFKINTNQ